MDFQDQQETEGVWLEGKARASFRMELQEQKDTEAGRASRHASLNEVGKWPGGLWLGRLSGVSGSGGCHEVMGSLGRQDVRSSGGHWEFRNPRCGQEAMGSGDPIQEVQKVS